MSARERVRCDMREGGLIPCSLLNIQHRIASITIWAGLCAHLPVGTCVRAFPCLGRVVGRDRLCRRIQYDSAESEPVFLSMDLRAKFKLNA